MSISELVLQYKSHKSPRFTFNMELDDLHRKKVDTLTTKYKVLKILFDWNKNRMLYFAIYNEFFVHFTNSENIEQFDPVFSCMLIHIKPYFSNGQIKKDDTKVYADLNTFCQNLDFDNVHTSIFIEDLLNMG